MANGNEFGTVFDALGVAHHVYNDVHYGALVLVLPPQQDVPPRDVLIDTGKELWNGIRLFVPRYFYADGGATYVRVLHGGTLLATGLES